MKTISNPYDSVESPIRDMLKPNDNLQLSLQDRKDYGEFSNLSTCLSQLATSFTDPDKITQYQSGIGSLDLNNFEWYKFLGSLNDSNSSGHPHVINLHLSRIHDHLIPCDYRCAYEVAYMKIMDLEYKSKLDSSDIRQTILSLWWIRKVIFSYIQWNPEINERNISLFLSCPESSDKSSNVTVQIRIENTSLANVKRLLTVINALYNRIQEVLDEMSADDNAKYAVHFQVKVSRTIINMNDIREQNEQLKIDLQKIFKYFVANTTPYELAKVLDTWVDVIVRNDLSAILDIAPYRGISAFCKIFYQQVANVRSNTSESGFESIELPHLYFGLKRSEYCDEVTKNKYYTHFQKRYGSILTADYFVACISNDEAYPFKIDVFRCKECELVHEQVGNYKWELTQVYPVRFRFKLKLDHPILNFEMIQDIIALYYAIIEYIIDRYGLVDFECYGDCTYTNTIESKQIKQTKLCKINEMMFKVFEDCVKFNKFSIAETNPAQSKPNQIM